MLVSRLAYDRSEARADSQSISQEVVLDSFVPNSALLHGGHGIKVSIHDQNAEAGMAGIESDPTDDVQRTSLMVLTGSNASGKSVYGKMVALLTYMCVWT